MKAVVLPEIEDDPVVVLTKTGGVEEDAVLTEADSEAVEATSRRPTPSRNLGPVSPKTLILVNTKDLAEAF